MTPDEQVESAAEALYHRDRAESEMPPKLWAQVPERVKAAYRAAVSHPEQ